MSSLHYCVWGLCESWEYCCGDNTCCRETDFNSLLLTIFILGTLIVVALFCICVYCSSQRIYVPFLKKYFRIIYVLMSTSRENTVGSTIKKETTTEDYVVEVQTTKVSV
ncbi:uncharacterized protein LOC143179523 [Calliopsis andreniformis]|uniref:uncharacterized protein LOC143179523 n=1 Tax=Calliopsis andreniformis TaxID=337506 RepID=UPI003FCE7EE8